MRYLPASGGAAPILELSRHNLLVLLAKLDDPASKRMLIAPTEDIAVVAVENPAHYADRDPGLVKMPTSGEYRIMPDEAKQAPTGEVIAVRDGDELVFMGQRYAPVPL